MQAVAVTTKRGYCSFYADAQAHRRTETQTGDAQKQSCTVLHYTNRTMILHLMTKMTLAHPCAHTHNTQHTPKAVAFRCEHYTCPCLCALCVACELSVVLTVCVCVCCFLVCRKKPNRQPKRAVPG